MFFTQLISFIKTKYNNELAHGLTYSETERDLDKASVFEDRYIQCTEHQDAKFCDTHDARNAMWFYLRAALRGDKEAQYKLGLFYLNGDFGLDRSYTQAEKWLDQAADQGHSGAKSVLEKALNHLVLS